jgi:hypothetical protein
MIISTGTNGLNLPYNPLLSSGYTSGQFLRYTFGQGLSYSRNSSTMRDMYANANGTVRNQSSSLYYPNKEYGMYYLNNTSGYSASNLGLTLELGTSTSDNFTVFCAWEYVASNLTYGADIIMGAYQGSSHDWWIGQTGYSSTQPYSVSRNGTFLSTLGTAPVVGRKYIACFGNSVSTSSTYFQLWDNAGNWYSSGNTVPAVSLSTAGVVAVGKYGGWNDNYMPRIYVGEAWYCTFLPYTTTWTLYNYIKKKYSGTWYNL